MRIFRLLTVVLALICLLPLASVALSSLIAGSAGCQLNEAGVHPCVINGRDYGEVVYAMFVSGWFALVTVPALVVIVLIWAVGEISHTIWKMRNREQK
jgi:hypothetical protein